jgi:hypothetical protein
VVWAGSGGGVPCWSLGVSVGWGWCRSQWALLLGGAHHHVRQPIKRTVWICCKSLLVEEKSKWCMIIIIVLHAGQNTLQRCLLL